MPSSGVEPSEIGLSWLARADHGEAGAVVDQPGPAGAELTDAGLLDLALEVRERAEGRVDRVGQRAVGLATAVGAHALPKQRVVVVAAGVVAHRGRLVAQAARDSSAPPRRACRPTPCPRGRRWPCPRRPGGACRGGRASSPRRCGARARCSRKEDPVLSRPSVARLLGGRDLFERAGDSIERRCQPGAGHARGAMPAVDVVDPATAVRVAPSSSPKSVSAAGSSACGSVGPLAAG